MPNSLLYLVATLIWGSTWLAITFQFGVVPPSVSVAYRFLIAGGLLALWCKSRGLSLMPNIGQLKWVALQGILMFGLSYILVYDAERHISSGQMAVLNSSMVLMNIIGLRLAFGNPLTKQSMVGATLGMIGIVCVFWRDMANGGAAHSFAGTALGLMAALIASLGNLVAQRNRNANLPLLPTISVGMMAGGTFALGVAIVGQQALVLDTSLSYLLSLGYLAVFGSVLAFAGYLTLLGRVGAGRAGYVAVAVPIVALVFSSYFEHFAWTAERVLGICLVASGNVAMLINGSTVSARIRQLRAAV
jgi:drug/metabolite transporter (DMT)-like permease